MPTKLPRWSHRALLVLGMLVGGAQVAESQPASESPSPAASPAPAATQPDAKPFTAEELAQLVAPIALYPDSLLAQIFMASTYPLEVVQAERWVAENKDLKGDALAAELNQKAWDPSVKSLVDVPQVLTMMSKDLDWTTRLGDAFIADQKAVMDAVQQLRAKAQAEGTLKTTAEQTVTVEQAPAQTVVVEGAAPPQIIQIESSSPDVVYVPAYNPTVVYGAWPYPAYPPPAPYYPPGYVASNVISFGAGVALGAAWGHAWGGCDWGHGEVDIDVDRNTNFNRNINRESYKQNIQNRTGTVQAGAGKFQHDSAHRKGVSYRDQASARQVGQLSANQDAARARESYRGRADTGRQEMARTGAADRSAARPDAARAGGTPSRSPAAAGRSSSYSGTRGSAFADADRGGSSARSASSRGASSRSAGTVSRGGGSRGGAAAGGRGGGGRGGGGRGGGRR